MATMLTERITFSGHDGSQLAARLDLPQGAPLSTALFAHCFTCGKDIAAARRIAARLASMGIAVLRFDFTGLGHSEGEFGNTTFQSNAEDLKLAARYLASRGLAPDLIIGHSLGGAAVLRVAKSIESAKAVVTLGAPFDPGHVTHNFAGGLTDIMDKGQADIDLGGRPVTIGRAFVQDVLSVDLADDIAHLKKALLVLHAPRDKVVDVSNATQIFSAAKHPKSFVTLDDADHLISDSKDANYAADVIAAWAGRYLPLRPPAPPIGAPEGVVRVTEVSLDGFLQDIQNGPWHHAIADEPAAYGGENKGMSPYGFVSSGLGACTSMTIRMYARRKGLALEKVTVDVTHDKVHAQDADGQGKERVDKFTRKIMLTGDLTEADRTRLVEIADKCPVHRTLESTAVIETELIKADPTSKETT